MTAVPGAWAEAAACRNRGPTMEMPGGGRGHGFTIGQRNQIAAARRICDGCPVLAPCRAWAMTTPDPAVYMVAGGLTPGQRDNVRKGAPLDQPARRRTA
jgi:hypothetical protein